MQRAGSSTQHQGRLGAICCCLHPSARHSSDVPCLAIQSSRRIAKRESLELGGALHKVGPVRARSETRDPCTMPTPSLQAPSHWTDDGVGRPSHNSPSDQILYRGPFNPASEVPVELGAGCALPGIRPVADRSSAVAASCRRTGLIHGSVQAGGRNALR